MSPWKAPFFPSSGLVCSPRSAMRSSSVSSRPAEAAASALPKRLAAHSPTASVSSTLAAPRASTRFADACTRSSLDSLRASPAISLSLAAGSCLGLALDSGVAL